MRELVFTLTYEPDCNAVAEVLAEHPDAGIRSLSLHATPESLWRVDHATGSPAALDAIEDAFLTADYYADCLATDHPGATQRTQVLEHDSERLVLYSYWERTPACASVPHVALEYLGEGALFETRHEGREYTWRIIHPGGDVRGFFDSLEAAVEESATIDIGRLSDVTSPRTDTKTQGTGSYRPSRRLHSGRQSNTATTRPPVRSTSANSRRRSTSPGRHWPTVSGAPRHTSPNSTLAAAARPRAPRHRCECETGLSGVSRRPGEGWTVRRGVVTVSTPGNASLNLCTAPVRVGGCATRGDLDVSGEVGYLVAPARTVAVEYRIYPQERRCRTVAFDRSWVREVWLQPKGPPVGVAGTRFSTRR
jgi:hypothetical protein